jgi:hypothetical protein
MSSISSILADQLDLIGKDDDGQDGAKQVEKKTASSLLLEEKKKNRALLEELDFIPVSAHKERPTNAIFDQIALTTVDPPTYWKDAGKDSVKSSGKGKPTVIPMAAGNKKKMDKIRKGEDYADRFNEKKAGKNHRNKRIESLKRPY